MVSPNVPPADITFSIMPTDGSSGQFVTTDGLGHLSFSSYVAGDVVGPGSSTNHAIATWNGTSGTFLNNTSATIGAAGELSIHPTADAADLRIFASASQTLPLSSWFNNSSVKQAEMDSNFNFDTLGGIKIGELNGTGTSPSIGQIIALGTVTLGTDPSNIVIPGSALQTLAGSGVDTNGIGNSFYYEFIGSGPGPYTSNKSTTFSTMVFNPAGSPITVSGGYNAFESLIQMSPTIATTPMNGAMYGQRRSHRNYRKCSHYRNRGLYWNRWTCSS